MARDANTIASQIEKDTDPTDRSRAVSIDSMNDGFSAAQEAAAHGLVDAVASKLESDGFPDAAEMVRSYKDTDPNSSAVLGDDDLNSALAALLGADDDDDEGIDD